mmetsp:Transcript_21392/g.70870  ORF Transcript_21392/g.70870 Transcript_21392/m.70870 type:complete len:884 (+) Transcript_21392:367-3018(+)
MQDYKSEKFDILEEEVQLVLKDLTLKLLDIDRLISVRELGELIHEDENKRLQTRRDILRDCSILVLLVQPTWLSTPFVSQVFDLLCVNRAVFIVSLSKDPVDKIDLEINNQNLQIFDSRGPSIERLVHLIKARTSPGREEHGADIVTIIYSWKNSLDAYEQGSIPSLNSCRNSFEDPRMIQYQLQRYFDGINGFHCWIDIEHGSDLMRFGRLSSHLRAQYKSKCVIVAASDDLLADSENFLREFMLESGFHLSIPVVVVQLGELQPANKSLYDSDLQRLLLAHKSIRFSGIEEKGTFEMRVHQLARLVEKEIRMQSCIENSVPLIPRPLIVHHTGQNSSNDARNSHFESFSFLRNARMRIMNRFLRVTKVCRHGDMHLVPGDLCAFVGFEQEALAVEAYNPPSSRVRDQLQLIKGERIKLLHKIPLEVEDGLWYEGQNKKGRKGLVPSSHLQVLSAGNKIWVCDSVHQVGLFDHENFENSFDESHFKSEMSAEDASRASSFNELVNKYGEFFQSVLAKALDIQVVDSAAHKVLMLTQECKLEDFQELTRDMESTTVLSRDEKQEALDEARKSLLSWYERVILETIERIKMKRTTMDYDMKMLKILDVTLKDVFLKGKRHLIPLSSFIENDHCVYNRISLVDLIQQVRQALLVEYPVDLQNARDGEFLDTEEDWQSLFDKVVSDWHGENQFSGTLVLYVIPKQQRTHHLMGVPRHVDMHHHHDEVQLICSTVILERTLPGTARRDIDLQPLKDVIATCQSHTVAVSGIRTSMAWSLVRQLLCNMFGCCVLLEYTPFDIAGNLEKQGKDGQGKGKVRKPPKSSRGLASKHSSTKTIRSEAEWREAISRVVIDSKTYNILGRKFCVDLLLDAVQDLKPHTSRTCAC